MEKKKTIVLIICAVLMAIFAVGLIKIANGTATTDRLRKENGGYDYGNVLRLFIPFILMIMTLSGIIVILQDDGFLPWISSVGAIFVVNLVGFIFNFMHVTAIITGGLYAIFWTVSAIRNLSALWYDYWETKLFAICRILLAAALIMFVIVWVRLPVDMGVVQDMSSVKALCGWAGGVGIASAVGLVIEAFLWIRADI